MPVSDLCSRGIVTVEKNASLQFTAQQMKNQHVGSIVVTEGNGHAMKPIGIVTDRDIAIKRMQQNGVRRLLVTDKNNTLCGVLSADDLVLMLGEEMQALGSLFQRQTWNEDRQFPQTHPSDEQRILS